MNPFSVNINADITDTAPSKINRNAVNKKTLKYFATFLLIKFITDLKSTKFNQLGFITYLQHIPIIRNEIIKNIKNTKV